MLSSKETKAVVFFLCEDESVFLSPVFARLRTVLNSFYILSAACSQP